MAERHEGSEEFYEMMEDDIEKGYQKEKFEKEIRMNKEVENRAIDIEIGEEIAEELTDQMLEEVKLAEKEQ